MKKFLVRVLVMPCGVVAGAALGTWLWPAQVSLTREDPPPPAPSRVEQLVDRYDCWTSDATNPPFPGHVVVTLPDGRVVYGGARRTGQALDQLFGGADHNLTVHAFCR